MSLQQATPSVKGPPSVPDFRLRAKARAVLASDQYLWEESEDPQCVTLRVLSPNSGLWVRHTVSEAGCSCAAIGPCYHLELLSLCGGVAGVRHAIRRDRSRGRCRTCGASIERGSWCRACWDKQVAADFGGR